MRVAVFHGASMPVTIEHVPDPQPGPKEVLLQVGFCGICGSDVSMTSGKGWDYEPGTHLGHEYCGRVVEAGSQVQSLKVGDLVACIPNGFCGKCRACREGRLLSCRDGKPQMGGMGEYVSVSEPSAVPLAHSLGLGDAALVEPIACARRALRVGRVHKGDHVLVIGAGPLALAVIHNAVLSGAARIGVLSRTLRGRDLAMQFGASYFLSDEHDGDDAMGQLLCDPPDVVVECAGASGLLTLATEVVRPGGTIIAMGMCGSPDPVTPILCNFKELTVVFPLGYSVADFEAAIRDFDRGAVSPATMITQIIGLNELPKHLSAMRDKSHHGKVLVDPFR
jgi:threonine dehydrogenase-like Zn-dependent dehydrogenase